MKKNTKIIIGVLILMIIGVVAYMGVQQVIFKDVIYKPQWGSLGCIKDDSPQILTNIWLDQQTLFKCGDNYLVDNCDFEIMNTRGIGFLSMGFCYSICDFNGENCFGKTCEGWNAWSSGPTYTKKINAGQSLLFSNNRMPNHIMITQTYYPYRLWTEEGGGHWLSRSSDCSLADQNEIKKRDVKYGDWITLDKTGSRKYLNYVIDWVATSGSKIYSYQGSKVICGNNVLYKLDTMKMADGNIYNIQGEIIKAVQCCPHQTANCDSLTFNFLPEDEPEERECDYSYECENGGIPFAISDTRAIQEKCVSGECVRDTLTIECGSDAKCRQLYGTNYVCDLTFANFGECIQSGLIPQAYCGDGICQTGETSNNCPIDCSVPPVPPSMCAWYQDAYTKIEKDYGSFYWRAIVPFIDAKETPISGCKTSGWVYMLGFGIIIIILGSVLIFSMKKGGKK